MIPKQNEQNSRKNEDLQEMKIVIVDDDCLVTEALKTILEVNEDVQVLATGSDGRDAVCRMQNISQMSC